jgi:hypothetical protein
MARHIAGMKRHGTRTSTGVSFSLSMRMGGKRGWMQLTLLSSPHYSAFFVMGLP